MSGINGNGDLGQQMVSSTNCIGGLYQGYDYQQRSPSPTLDVTYFLKHASEQVLVDMYKRIPDELRDRVNAARVREREAQRAYEQVIDAQSSEAK